PETWFRPDDTLELVLRALVIDTNGNRLDGNHDGNEDGSPVDDYRLLFTTGPGVFPGDANHDGRVDEADILPLGRFWGLHGRPRTPASTDFSMQPAHAWTPREATHADGDGNGVVDANDICPIAEFFSRDTSLAKLQFAAWAAEVRAWPDTILSSLLAALEGCSGSQAGVQALREALTQGHGPAPIPSDFALDQNYPNPFNPSTVIEYSLKSPETVRLEIFDVTGRRVALLDEGPKPVGRHRSVWDGQDDGGQALASGIYFYRLTSPDFRFVRKMVLLR
ncbi:MAG: T9SS type A sorting domain-containing protein, partial [Acidobacteria bacterium]|nr:T9SS type A sorting domain-containing protein [Acidobacteriota bacterium]